MNSTQVDVPRCGVLRTLSSLWQVPRHGDIWW